MTTVVGINRTQDGSVAVTRGGASMYSLQKERLSRRKHHWGRLGDLPNLYLGVMPWLDEPVDLVVEGWSSDAEVDRAVQPRHPAFVELREVAEPTPVVLAPADALLLEAVHGRAPARHGDRAVLSPVDADNGSRVDRHERLQVPTERVRSSGRDRTI